MINYQIEEKEYTAFKKQYYEQDVQYERFGQAFLNKYVGIVEPGSQVETTIYFAKRAITAADIIEQYLINWQS